MPIVFIAINTAPEAVATGPDGLPGMHNPVPHTCKKIGRTLKLLSIMRN